MGETLIGIRYGLAPDKLLEAHQVLISGPGIRKTPYQLDLETKDRKPDVAPKVGDKVKIKSREWYEKWKDSEGHVYFDTTDCVFVNVMKDLCGRELTVRDIIEYENSKDEKRWELSTNGWWFVPEMFEEVYPVQEQINSPFPKIDFNSMADFVEIPLTVPPFSVKGGELIVAKTTVSSMIEDTAKRIAAYTSVQGLAAKPKLKQVNTTRLLKLKKL